MPAQMKAFFDATGGLWVKGALVGKGVSAFVSTGTQGGGSETTVLTSIPNFAHHGMVYIPVGYTFADQTRMDILHGGTAYVSRRGVVAGDSGDPSRVGRPPAVAGACRPGFYVLQWHCACRSMCGAGSSGSPPPSTTPPRAQTQPPPSHHPLPSEHAQGATTFAGPDGSRQPIEQELAHAEHQVRRWLHPASAGTQGARARRDPGMHLSASRAFLGSPRPHHTPSPRLRRASTSRL